MPDDTPNQARPQPAQYIRPDTRAARERRALNARLDAAEQRLGELATMLEELLPVLMDEAQRLGWEEGE